MIHILNHQTDKIEGWVNHVIEDSHQHSIKNEETYDFHVSVDEKDADKLTNRARLLIPSEEGDYREFIVDYPYEHTATKRKEVYSIGSFADLRKSKIIPPQVLDAQSIRTAANMVLDGLEWEVGIVEYSNIRKWTIEKHVDAYDALKAIASLFETELRFRVTVDGDKVSGRYVDFIKRQGLNRGKEIVFGKDLVGVTRKVHADRIVTALHCIGPERQDGTRLETVVTNDAAYQAWNRKGKHLIEIYQPETSDDNMSLERLTQLGETELNKRITAAIEYEVDAVSLEHIFGYEHEITRLGDSAKIKDEHFNHPMYLDSRVIFVDRSVFNPSKKTYKLGEVIEYSKEDVMAVWRELQALHGMKLIKSPEPPEGRNNTIWIKPGEIELAHTWDSDIQEWKMEGPDPDQLLHLAELYNGVTIDHENGVTVLRSDNLVRTVLNATGGIKIQRRATVNDLWSDMFYVDTEGHLYVLNAKIAGELIGDVVNGGTLIGQKFRSGGVGSPIQFFIGDANTDTYKMMEIYNGSVRMPGASLTTNGSLHSKDNATLHRFYIGTGTNYEIMTLSSTDATIKGDLTVVGNINGTTVGSSDERLKCEIEDHIADDLTDLLNINLIKFNYLYDAIDEHRRIGFFAQQGPQDVVAIDKDGMLGIDLYSLISKNIGAIKQLNAKLEAQQTEINEIKQHLGLEG